MKKALVAILAVGAMLGLRQGVRRAGHKVCQHCGAMACKCGHAA